MSLDDFKVRVPRPKMWVCAHCFDGDGNDIPEKEVVQAISQPTCPNCKGLLTECSAEKLMEFYCPKCFPEEVLDDRKTLSIDRVFAKSGVVPTCKRHGAPMKNAARLYRKRPWLR
jgi:hypothetical protein